MAAPALLLPAQTSSTFLTTAGARFAGVAESVFGNTASLTEAVECEPMFRHVVFQLALRFGV